MKRFSWKPILILAIIITAVVMVLPTLIPDRVKLTNLSFSRLAGDNIPAGVMDRLYTFKELDYMWEKDFVQKLESVLVKGDTDKYKSNILKHAEKLSLWPHKKINLGLDLQGGMHLTLQVESDEAVKDNIQRISQEIRSLLKKERIRQIGIELIQGTQISILIPDDQNLEKFEAFLDKEYRGMRVVSRLKDGEKTRVILDLPESRNQNIKEMAVRQVLETIRNRIDQFGVAEPDIRRQGERRLIIQLPGVKDTQKAKELIGRTALLEFKLLNESMSAEEALKGRIPRGSQILYKITENPETNQVRKTPFLLKKQTLLTGASLTDAKVRVDQQTNESYVLLSFDKKGGKIFERITGDNVNKHLAIILDNKVYSAPQIREKISGGNASITGSFSDEEANILAIALRAGALPATVTPLEERTVGPSLGVDSRNKGLISMCIGGILVILFMVIYYKGSGLIADVALILNIILIAGGLAGFGATLTLPGIAGIILTIGMAVDANVLIFERIREEMKLGKTPRAAVDAGYDRATLTILDANVTTLIAALVLFQFGTGAVQGFAVTLSLGVLASLFTALIMTRTIFDYLLMNRKVKRLSI